MNFNKYLGCTSDIINLTILLKIYNFLLYEYFYYYKVFSCKRERRERKREKKSRIKVITFLS